MSNLIETPVTSFDNVQLPSVNQVRQNPFGKQNQKKEEQPPTKFWINVGVKRGDKLVSLPAGIPLDRLVAKKIPNVDTKNPEFRNLRIGEAQLWAKIQEIMQTLKPGERSYLKLDCEIYHTKESEQVDLDDQAENPFAIGDIL